MPDGAPIARAGSDLTGVHPGDTVTLGDLVGNAYHLQPTVLTPEYLSTQGHTVGAGEVWGVDGGDDFYTELWYETGKRDRVDALLEPWEQDVGTPTSLKLEIVANGSGTGQVLLGVNLTTGVNGTGTFLGSFVNEGMVETNTYWDVTKNTKVYYQLDYTRPDQLQQAVAALRNDCHLQVLTGNMATAPYYARIYRCDVLIINDELSTDASGGHAVTFHWSQIDGTPVTFNPSDSIINFTAPEVEGGTTLTFALTVTDGNTGVVSDPDYLTVDVLAPLAPINTYRTVSGLWTRPATYAVATDTAWGSFVPRQL